MKIITRFTVFINSLFPSKPGFNNIFNHYFFEQKYYLHNSASLENFAKLLNTNTDKLDYISKKYYSSSFQELIQQARYDHLLKEFQNPFNASLPIDSVIKLSGFDNNESFVNYAKEIQHNNLKSINL
jgi:AraC-like DNA-binding protein